MFRKYQWWQLWQWKMGAASIYCTHTHSAGIGSHYFLSWVDWHISWSLESERGILVYSYWQPQDLEHSGTEQVKIWLFFEWVWFVALWINTSLEECERETDVKCLDSLSLKLEIFSMNDVRQWREILCCVNKTAWTGVRWKHLAVCNFMMNLFV